MQQAEGYGAGRERPDRRGEPEIEGNLRAAAAHFASELDGTPDPPRRSLRLVSLPGNEAR